MFSPHRYRKLWSVGLLWLGACAILAFAPHPAAAAKGTGVRIIASDAQHVVLQVNAPAP